jgi:exportin-7
MAQPRPIANALDIYKTRYKGMSLAMNVLNSALGGNYVCFGVFALYNDQALDSSLDITLQMALSIPLDDVVAYPKLSKAFYGFIEIIFRNHQKTVFALDTLVFMQLMTAVHEGLQSSDATLSSLCANSIDHLATFYFQTNGKDKVEMHNLNKVSKTCLSSSTIVGADIFSHFPFSRVHHISTWLLNQTCFPV